MVIGKQEPQNHALTLSLVQDAIRAVDATSGGLRWIPGSRPGMTVYKGFLVVVVVVGLSASVKTFNYDHDNRSAGAPLTTTTIHITNPAHRSTCHNFIKLRFLNNV